MLDIVTTPLLSVTLDGRAMRVSLPEALEALGGEQIVAFQRVRAHQKHALFAFCAQVAALALDAAKEEGVVHPAEAWREMLLALTGGRVEPWSLVVEDLTQPALLQPAVSVKYKARYTTPQELDLLVVAKNHDIKSARACDPSAEDWLLALLTLQTCEGFSGRGNYGVMRMNGGLGSRPCVAFTPTLDWGGRWRRDVAGLLRRRRDAGWGEEKLHRLLWLLPWSGGAHESLPITAIDKDAIEISRLRRLHRDEAGVIYVTGAPTDAARVAAGETKGDVGDYWTPINIGKETKSLTLSSGGFHYGLVSQLLFHDDYRPSPAQGIDARDEAAGYLWMEGLTRGQGKTEGFHQRTLRITPRLKRQLRRVDERTKLAARARDWIKDAETARLKILKPALLVTLQAKSGKNLNNKDKRADPWLRRLDQRVDQCFFESLEGTLDAPDARSLWRRTLWGLVREIFAEAQASLPLPASRKYRSIAMGESALNGLIYKHFSDLKEVKAG